MSQTRASKTRGRKLDSIISKLKVHPSQEAVDSPNVSSKPEDEGSAEKGEEEKNSQKEPPATVDVDRKKSKRKSNVIVRYRIDDDGDVKEEKTDEVVEMTSTANTSPKSPDNKEDAPENDSQLPEAIFEELPNGEATAFEEDDTTVLFLAPDKIEVKAGPSDDYLSVLLEGGEESNHEEHELLPEEDGENKEKGKKKKKKKKTYDSDESLDEVGLPRRVMCTACGRNVNPSHGTILRHPVLNVLVCKKCNQYYNSGPFTRDEYGIEEQCRWCGDGGDLICCDDCEKVYCKSCIQRNLGKTYLKNLLNAPEDFKWLCVVCQKDKPTKHIQKLRKKCEQVMQVLENVKFKKAHFKSKKGQLPSVVSGPTTSERRNRLNCLSEGIKADGVSLSGESPTKKCFDADLPAKLFNEQQTEESNLERNTTTKEKDACKTISDKADASMDGSNKDETKDMGAEDNSDEEVLSKKAKRLTRSRSKDEESDEHKKSDEEDLEHTEESERKDEYDKQEEGKESESEDTGKKISKTKTPLNRESSKDEEDEQDGKDEEQQYSEKEIPKRKTRSQLNRESSKDEEGEQDEEEEEQQYSEKEIPKRKTRSQLNRESSKDEEGEQDEEEEEQQGSRKEIPKQKRKTALNQELSKDEKGKQDEEEEEQQYSDKEVPKRKTRSQINQESSKDKENDEDKEVLKQKRKSPLNSDSTKDESDEQNGKDEEQLGLEKKSPKRKTRTPLNRESSKDEEDEQNVEEKDEEQHCPEKESPKPKRRTILNRESSKDEDEQDEKEQHDLEENAAKQNRKSLLNQESSKENNEEQYSDEEVPKRKTRSQLKEESEENTDNLENGPKTKQSKKVKKTQEEQNSTPKKSQEQDDSEGSTTEEDKVRVTRRGKIGVAKPRRRQNSKDTPQQSEDETVKQSDTARNKGKSALERIKKESQSDEQDSSDSSLGRRLSRKSKDRANKLMSKPESKNRDKKQQPKAVVVIDLDDDSETNDSGYTETKEKKKKKKNKDSIASSKDKTEKSTDSSDSHSKPTRSRRSKTSDSPVRSKNIESDLNESDSDENTSKSYKGNNNFKNKERGKEKARKASNLKKEKNTDSSGSDSKPTRSRRRRKISDSPVRSKRVKQESESDESDSDEKSKTKKSKRKQPEDEMSSDSDFETKKKTSKKSTNSKKQKNIEHSSDSEEDTPSKYIMDNSDYSLEESSESDESSSDGESDVQPTSSRRRGLQKQTRKRPRPVASSSNSEQSSEESSNDEKVAKRTRKRKQIESDSSDESPKRGKQPAKNKREKKTVKKGRKGRRTRKNALQSEESEASGIAEESSESESEPEKKKKKGKQRKQKQKGKRGAKNKKRRRVKDNSEDSSDDGNEDKSPSKGRKKIRKLLTDEKLGEETRRARRLEEERRKRLLERTRTAEDEEMPKESWHINHIYLELDKETKEPLVEVHQDLVQHLKPHQSKGIQFMYDNVVDSIEAYKKGDKGGGCILAHCMGLGKTLQVVSLIHTLHNHKAFEFKTTLVIAPLNTVLNWQVEFDKWLNVDERMDVYVLKEAGHNNWHRADMLKQWQRYGGVMIIGYDSYRNLAQCSRVRSKHQKKIFKESLVDPGPDLVVCDEGHILRNDQSAISKAVNSIKTRRRIALTGTPLQNNLVEYHCMVSFVKPNLLGTRKEFMNLFGNPIMNGQCVDSSPLDVKLMKQSAHVLYKLLEGCVQRRDYSVLTPFLPPKHEYVVKIRLSEVQRKLYSQYLNTFVFPDGNASMRGASLFSDYQCLMRIWTHPWCLKLEAIRRSLRAPYSDSENSLDGFVVHTDEESESEVSSDEMSLKSDSSTPDKGTNKKNGEVFELKSSSDEESDDDKISDEEVMPQPSRRMTRSNAPATIKDEKSMPNDKDTEKTVNGDESNTRSGANFKEEAVEEKEWYDEFLTPEDEDNVELSGKMALLLEILADAEAVEEKVLVFSQSLVTLDLIERAIGGGEVGGDRENWCRGCDYFRMDGSTNVQYRQRWADIFNDPDNKTARLFLISTKAGGLGINLVAANRVVVFDVSWNPSHDVQSIFRVFRFGQTKPVYVYRLVAEGSMEERIYDRQIAKLSTSQRVVDKHQIERHFTAADLAELYRFTPSIYDEEKDKDSVPSLPLPKDAVLADLINRMHPKWIVKYHEHDSLLQNKSEEELTEDECKQAWSAYEAQKNQGTQNYNARLLQAQYAQQQLEQQRQAIPSQNVNYSNAVLRQMQEYQRQQLARMQALQMQQSGRYATPGQPIHNEQLRQQLLQHLGAARPVYPAPPPPGATYQPMVRYVTQQPGQQMLRPQVPPPVQHQPAASSGSQPNPIVIRHGPPTYRL